MKKKKKMINITLIKITRNKYQTLTYWVTNIIMVILVIGIATKVNNTKIIKKSIRNIKKKIINNKKTVKMKV